MKKAMNIIKKVAVWAVVLIAVAMMIFTVVSVTTFNRNDRNLFGYKMYIVKSDSMAATDFKAGSLIFVKTVDPTTLKEGDIIRRVPWVPTDPEYIEMVNETGLKALGEGAQDTQAQRLWWDVDVPAI